MITVAGTYLHITRHIYEETDFQENRQKFEDFLVQLTRETYGQDFEIVFYIDEGGTYLNILVGTAALVTILSQAPSAVENAQEYGEKAMNYGSQVIEQVQEIFDVSEEDIDWKQRRRGDVKKILNIAKHAQSSRAKGLSDEELERLKEAIERDLYRLSSKISDIKELTSLLKELPRDVLSGLPAAPEEVRAPVVALRPRGPTSASSAPVAARRGRRRRIYKTTLKS